jgi:hypothetical protein
MDCVVLTSIHSPWPSFGIYMPAFLVAMPGVVGQGFVFTKHRIGNATVLGMV